MKNETSKAQIEPELTRMVSRRLVAIGILVAACLAVTSVFYGSMQIIMSLQDGAAIDWGSLLSFAMTPEDGLILGAIFILMGLECIHVGWQSSALRRILTESDPGTRTDIFYFVIAVTGLLTVMIKIATLGLGAWANALIAGGVGLQLGVNLPIWLACLLVYILQSFCIYWSHRFVHTPLMWPLHAVHHEAKDFNVITAARHHPVDAFFGDIAGVFIPAMIGFPAEAILIVGMFVTLYTIFIHTHLPMPDWIGRYVVHGPRGHGIHHSRDRRHYDTNFGDLVLWDRLFGTYNEDAPEVLTYGCDDPHGIYASGRPIHDMLAVQVLWLRRLWYALVKAGQERSLMDGGRLD